MRATLVFCLAIAAAGHVLAQPDPSLKAAAEARIAAAVAGDARAWGRYTTSDFVGISTDGSRMTRQQRMVEIEGHPIKPQSPTLRELQWRVYGDQTAIETYQVMDGGNPVKITVVWVKQVAIWKVASVQGTIVAKAP